MILNNLEISLVVEERLGLLVAELAAEWAVELPVELAAELAKRKSRGDKNLST